MNKVTKALLAAAAFSAAMSTAAAAEVTISGTLTDVEDGNRFFTRSGGEAHDSLRISGLEPGVSYVLVTTLRSAASGEEIEVVETEIAADGPEADVVVTLPVPRNEGDLNIDYVTHNLLRRQGEDAIVAEMTGDAADPERSIQVHSIQRIHVLSAKDAADGDDRIDGEGGQIEVTLRYENMVEDYDYTVWGQLLTPSGQSRGIFASIPSFAPETKAGELTLTFDVPPGLDGLSVTPSVGIFHQNRVEVRKDGNIEWIEGSPTPVMIASHVDLGDESLIIEVGIPFGQTE